MAWGGSINVKGTEYLRKVRELDKILKFLEEFKNEIGPEETKSISNTIDIIVNYMNKLSEGKL